jgi:hypothetical protein
MGMVEEEGLEWGGGGIGAEWSGVGFVASFPCNDGKSSSSCYRSAIYGSDEAV